MRRAAGFSMLELVVALVIAGILAAIALPYFTDKESKATWFHEQVKAAVRYAQRQAVAQRRCIFVQITSNQVGLFYGDTNCTTASAPVTLLAATVEGKSAGDSYVLTAPSGVTIDTTVTFRFNGLGQPSGAVSFNVAGRPVSVTAETGYVQ